MSLCNNNKTCLKSVAKLVGDAFVYNSNPDENLLVLHKNGNSLDNESSNLYWGNYKDAARNGRAKPICVYDKNTGKLVKEFDSLTDACDWLKATVANAKNVESMISNCLRGNRASSYGFIYKYKNKEQDKGYKKAPAGFKKEVSVYTLKDNKFIGLFPNVNAVVKWLCSKDNNYKYNSVSIYGCLQGKYKSIYGYRYEWEYSAKNK